MKPTDEAGLVDYSLSAVCVRARRYRRRRVCRSDCAPRDPANSEALFQPLPPGLATLERLAAPDFRFDHQGQKGDRRTWLDAVATRTVTVDSITNDDLRLQVDGNHAILCGVQRALVLVDGTRVADEATFCDRWEQRDGHWLVTFAGEPTHPR